MGKDRQPERKVTQGHLKMMHYIEDVIRNKHFLKRLKQLRKSANPLDDTKGTYDGWTSEQKKRHDWVNKELGEIIGGYEKLRKRCNKLLLDKGARKQSR